MLASLGVAQRTWVVDQLGGSGVDFTEIQPAINAAQLDDRIVVRARGVYLPFRLDKGVDLVGIDGTPLVTGSVVENVPAGDWARLTNLQLFSTHLNPLDGLRIENCGGPIFLRSVGMLAGRGELACHVVDCSNLVLSFCRIDGSDSFADSGAALFVERSSVYIRDTKVVGGNASLQGGLGGAAVRLNDGNVVVTHSTLTGGRGGPSSISSVDCSRQSDRGGPGGAGLEGSGRALVLDRTSVAGGPGGLAVLFARVSCVGIRGPSINARPTPARVTQDCILDGVWFGVARIADLPALSVPRNVPVGGSFTATVTAPSGSTVTLFIALLHAYVPAPFEVPLLVRPPTVPVGVAVADPGGVARFGLMLPPNPATRDALVFFQAVSVPGPNIQLSNSASMRVQ